MLIEYSDTGLLGAVTKTFNGENPCDLCDKIEQEKSEQEQQPELEVTLSDLKAVVPGQAGHLSRHPSGEASYNFGPSDAHARSAAPSLPPPRLV